MLLALIPFREANATEICDANPKVIQVAKSSDIDLRTKSAKGWLRLLRNADKAFARYPKLSEIDRKYIIACFVNHYNRNTVGRMR